jgi:hypothetical protein
LSRSHPGQSSLLQASEINSINQTVAAAAGSLGQPGLSFRYVQTLGMTQTPYLADTTHINRPTGLFMDSSNNLYVAEAYGYRILKYNSAGANLLAIGKAGVSSTENYMFSSPQDISTDSSGNIWVSDGNRLVEYDSSGVFIQQYPQDDPWNSGSDNSHFNNVHGVSFDSGGYLFVSDTNNQRIQVFDMTGGSPIYSATIGETGVSGNDGSHFNQPLRIAVDSSNHLYVVDSGNGRVQKCIESSGWTCSTFVGGLNQPNGISLDSSNNVYIADTMNGRILKCTPSANCSTFEQGAYWPNDVAVDSSGNVYGAVANGESFVTKYLSNGSYISPFVGVLFVPYLTDGYHYNHPRVAIDPGNNILILEENGQRLVKLDPSGNFLWSFGVPGVDASDNNHFNSPHGVATDSSGKIYVADNCRVQIISSDGTYLNTLGTGCGTGDYEFGWATGVDVDNNGNIYVADYPNHRVQIYNSSRVFIGRIGATGDCSTANDRLCTPIAVDVDASGNIYVTDSGNLRVQKFNSSHVWQMTIGDGTWGDSFSQLAWPEDVVVDTQGRIFVTDWSNNRVQVFDYSGAYLTTIGGSGGSNTSQLDGAPGIDIDSSGNVYVADWGNARIQKFAPGVPGWMQANINGFGDRNNNVVNRMSVFNGYLYAGTVNNNGGQVWRSLNGTSWNQVNSSGFGTASNTIAQLGETFNGNLYVGTTNSATGGEIWRCAICDGSDWTQVVSSGFGESNNTTVERVVVFSNTLYATTNNSATGVEVWKSSNGNPGSWTQSNTNGFGDTRNTGLWAVAVLNNYLYAATGQWGVPLDTDTYTGTEVWRTNNGSTWSQVNTDGFGDRGNMSPWLGSFNGYLYALSNNIFGTGAQLWRCATCDGTDWTQVVSDGFGDNNNDGGYFMLSYGGHFYVAAYNDTTGTEIWQTTNGTNWSQVNLDGYGDSNNRGTASGAVFNGSLFFGTVNDGNGGEVWQMLNQIYLPLVVR